MPHINYVLKEGRAYLAVLLFFAAIILVKQRLFPGQTNDSPRQTKLYVTNWAESPLWVEDQRPHVNPHRFRYLKNEEETCDTPVVDLLVLVASAVGHFEQREAIRNTWGQDHELGKYNAKLVFLLGQGREKQSLIDQESGMTHDIIQEDFQVRRKIL